MDKSDMKEVLNELGQFQAEKEEFEHYKAEKKEFEHYKEVKDAYGAANFDKLIHLLNSFAKGDVKKAPRKNSPKAKEGPGKGFPSQDYLASLSDEDLEKRQADAKAKADATGKDRLLKAINKAIEARKNGEPRKEPKQRKQREDTPNPNGPWGEEGKPTSIDEARKRLRQTKSEHKKVMIKNLIAKLKGEGEHQATPNKAAKKAGQAARAKAGDEDKAQSQDRQAAA